MHLLHVMKCVDVLFEVDVKRGHVNPLSVNVNLKWSSLSVVLKAKPFLIGVNWSVLEQPLPLTVRAQLNDVV